MTTTKEEEAMDYIMDACKILKWNICTAPCTEATKDEQVQGLIIGTEEFIQSVLTKQELI